MARKCSFLLLFIGAIGGAAATFLSDPHAGSRRRALVRDKLHHYRVAGPNRLGRWVRRIPGPVDGLVHGLGQRTPWHVPRPLPDQSLFLVQAVETELGREPDLPLEKVNFDAADGVVHVRGTVPDEQGALGIVKRAAGVEGVRAVISLMRTPEGRHIGGTAGDPEAIAAGPRAALQGEAVRQALMQRWPGLTDADIIDSGGPPKHSSAASAPKRVSQNWRCVRRWRKSCSGRPNKRPSSRGSPQRSMEWLA